MLTLLLLCPGNAVRFAGRGLTSPPRPWAWPTPRPCFRFSPPAPPRYPPVSAPFLGIPASLLSCLPFCSHPDPSPFLPFPSLPLTLWLFRFSCLLDAHLNGLELELPHHRHARRHARRHAHVGLFRVGPPRLGRPDQDVCPRPGHASRLWQPSVAAVAADPHPARAAGTGVVCGRRRPLPPFSSRRRLRGGTSSPSPPPCCWWPPAPHRTPTFCPPLRRPSRAPPRPPGRRRR